MKSLLLFAIFCASVFSGGQDKSKDAVGTVLIDLHISMYLDGKEVVRCDQYGKHCQFVNGGTLDDAVAAFKNSITHTAFGSEAAFHGWHKCESKLRAARKKTGGISYDSPRCPPPTICEFVKGIADASALPR